MVFGCFFGKHEWDDRIKITGPRTKEGLPVCVYQFCKKCFKTGNKVNCFISLKDIEDKEKG